MQLPTTIQLPGYLQNFTGNCASDDLTANTGGGFPVVSFRGRVWRIIMGGENTPVMDGTGQPVPSIEVVLIKGNPKISKIFYHDAYVEGSDDAPDCFSNDGEFPDASVAEPQSDNCAMCPQNVWGSKITPQGTKVKACSDSRRLAIVAAGEIVGGSEGIGPMLLRVPPASLEALRAYGSALNQRALPYNALITRVGFDLNASYPKLIFSAIRVLTETEFARVQKLIVDDRVSRILGGLGAAEYAATKTPTAQAPAPTPVAAPAPAPAPAPAAAPAPAPAAAPRRRRAAQPEQPSAQMTLPHVAPPAPAPAAAPVTASGLTPPPNLDIASIVSSALQGLDDAK